MPYNYLGDKPVQNAQQQATSLEGHDFDEDPSIEYVPKKGYRRKTDPSAVVEGYNRSDPSGPPSQKEIAANVPSGGEQQEKPVTGGFRWTPENTTEILKKRKERYGY